MHYHQDHDYVRENPPGSFAIRSSVRVALEGVFSQRLNSVRLRYPMTKNGPLAPKLVLDPPLTTSDFMAAGLGTSMSTSIKTRPGPDHEVIEERIDSKGKPYWVVSATFVGPSLFSNTSKMSCASWSIPAGSPAIGGSCPAAGAMLEAPESVRAATSRVIENLTGIQVRGRQLPAAPGQFSPAKKFVCDFCYAGKNNYANVGTQAWQILRRGWFNRWLSQDPESLIGQLVQAVRYMGEFLSRTNLREYNGVSPNFFRIHDSGDYESLDSVHVWNEVARALPGVLFWAPTRMWPFPRFVQAMQQAPSNLLVRPSAMHFDDPAPLVPGLAGGSGVSAENRVAWVCPVYTNQAKTCVNARRPRVGRDGDLLPGGEVCCRFCWGGGDVDDQPYAGLDVSYHAH